jgi:hypothetical protein
MMSGLGTLQKSGHGTAQASDIRHQQGRAQHADSAPGLGIVRQDHGCRRDETRDGSRQGWAVKAPSWSRTTASRECSGACTASYAPREIAAG